MSEAKRLFDSFNENTVDYHKKKEVTTTTSDGMDNEAVVDVENDDLNMMVASDVNDATAHQEATVSSDSTRDVVPIKKDVFREKDDVVDKTTSTVNGDKSDVRGETKFGVDFVNVAQSDLAHEDKKQDKNDDESNDDEDEDEEEEEEEPSSEDKVVKKVSQEDERPGDIIHNYRKCRHEQICPTSASRTNV